MPLYHDRGVVLRTHKLGEADRIVTMLTRAHGKVRAVAKGVRKTKSRFGGRLEPPRHIDLLLYEGRELDIVSQAETIDHFRTVRDDLDRLGRAVTMLEAADQLSMERQPNGRLYDMLVGALRALASQDAPLVVAGFFLKVLALEGFGPQVEECAVCGSPGPLVSWAIEEGGLRGGGHPAGGGGGSPARGGGPPQVGGGGGVGAGSPGGGGAGPPPRAPPPPGRGPKWGGGGRSVPAVLGTRLVA